MLSIMAKHSILGATNVERVHIERWSCLVPVEIFTIPKKGYISETYVLLYDNTVPISSSLYYILAAFAGVMLFLYNLPIIILTLYPFELFKRMLSTCRLDGCALINFIEKFHSCYRDGLEGGKDMWIFSGLYFPLRILISVGIQIPHNLNFEPWFHEVPYYLSQPWPSPSVNLTKVMHEYFRYSSITTYDIDMPHSFI